MYLVIGGVVNGSDDWFVMTHDAITDLWLHLHHCQLVVEGDEQLVPTLIKEQGACHYNQTFLISWLIDLSSYHKRQSFIVKKN